MKPMIHTKFSAESMEGDTLKGVIAAEVGEAKGHGFWIGPKFLAQLAKLCMGKVIKVHLNHPEDGKPTDLKTLCATAINWRMDGDKVRCDLALLDVPEKDRIKAIAKGAAEVVGMSLDCVRSEGKKLANGLREAFCEAVNALDFVDTPAATNSLFSQKVDSQIKDNMQLTLSPEHLAALGLDEKADEKAVHAALANVLTKAAKYDEGEKAKGGAAEHAEPDGDEAKEELAELEDKDEPSEKEVKRMCILRKNIKAGQKQTSMAANMAKEVSRLVAVQFTDLVSKMGIKPVSTGLTAEQVEEQRKQEAAKLAAGNGGLSEEQKAMAVKLGLDEKVYAGKLKAAGLLSTKL